MPDVIKEDDNAYYMDTGNFVPKKTMSPTTRAMYNDKLAAYQSRTGFVPENSVQVAPAPMSPTVLPVQSIGAPAVPAPIPLAPTAPQESQEGFVPAAMPASAQAPVVPQTMSVSTEGPSSSVAKKSMDKETKVSLDQATKGLIEAETKRNEAEVSAVQAQKDMAMAKAAKEEEIGSVILENEKTRQARLAEKNQHFEASVAQQASMQVDPNKYWAEKSTGAKIGVAIAMAMGAVGQALSRGNKNYALDVIDNAIDRDIAAQKANIAAKGDAVRAEENSLQAFRVRLGDERLAELAAKDVALHRVENSFIERMGSTKSEAAIAAGQKAISDIRQKRAEIMVQANQINSTNTSGSARSSVETKPIDPSARNVSPLWTAYGNAPDAEAAKTIRAADAAYKSGYAELKNYEDKIKSLGTLSPYKWGTKEKGNWDAATESVKNTLREVKNMGVLQPGESKELENRLGGIKTPAQLSAYADGLKSWLDRSIKSKLNAYGIGKEGARNPGTYTPVSFAGSGK